MDNMQKRNLEKNMAATVFNQAQFDAPPFLMKCLVAPDLRQTLTLLPLICDKKVVSLPLI